MYSLALFLLLHSVSATRQLTISNQCSGTIWPAFQSGNSGGVPTKADGSAQPAGWAQPKGDYTFLVPDTCESPSCLRIQKVFVEHQQGRPRGCGRGRDAVMVGRGVGSGTVVLSLGRWMVSLGRGLELMVQLLYSSSGTASGGQGATVRYSVEAVQMGFADTSTPAGGVYALPRLRVFNGRLVRQYVFASSSSSLPLTPVIFPVSIVDGFNLPMTIEPVNGQGAGCETAKCGTDTDILTACDPALVYPKGSDQICQFDGFSPDSADGGDVKGVAPLHVSADITTIPFDADNSPSCCTGQWSDHKSCVSSMIPWYETYKGFCPDAYVYSDDDNGSGAVFGCTGPDYTITFCPGGKGAGLNPPNVSDAKSQDSGGAVGSATGTGTASASTATGSVLQSSSGVQRLSSQSGQATTSTARASASAVQSSHGAQGSSSKSGESETAIYNAATASAVPGSSSSSFTASSSGGSAPPATSAATTSLATQASKSGSWGRPGGGGGGGGAALDAFTVVSDGARTATTTRDGTVVVEIIDIETADCLACTPEATSAVKRRRGHERRRLRH
ncbi:hypothetical protein P7C73_g4446, partial [Tremellales sp. Uapishka_1]